MDRNYHHVLDLLLRLRQICSHPCLILQDVGAFVPAEDVDHWDAEELARAQKLMSEEFVKEMKAQRKKDVLQGMEAEKRVILLFYLSIGVFAKGPPTHSRKMLRSKEKIALSAWML